MCIVVVTNIDAHKIQMCTVFSDFKLAQFEYINVPTSVKYA